MPERTVPWWWFQGAVCVGYAKVCLCVLGILKDSVQNECVKELWWCDLVSTINERRK